MDYQEERLEDVREEIIPLLALHWEDVALNKEDIILDPNWPVYDFMDAHNALHITTARQQGVLVGYAVYLISSWLHYKDRLLADGDIFWLAPEYRKGMTGVRLLKTAEKYLVARGVEYIVNKVKLHKDVGRVFEHLGYMPIERVYAKRVG